MAVPVARHLSFLGIAKEATMGTGVAATNDIRYTPGSLKVVPHVNYLKDQGQRGSMVETYDVRAGTTFGETAFSAPLFPDEFGWALAGILGDVVTTGASAPFTHTMAIKNNGQPKSYSLSDFDSVDTQQYTGQMFTDLGMKWQADGMLEYSVKTMGWAPNTPANPTASFTTVTIVPAWVGVITIAGAGNTNLMAAEINMKRPGTAQHTASGTQNPAFMFLGPLSVTGKLTFAMPDNAEMTRYLTNTQPSFVMDFQQGAGAALTEVKVTMTKCAYVTGAIDQSAKDFNTVEVGFEALSNSTDVGASAGFSPCKWVIQNQLAASTYV